MGVRFSKRKKKIVWMRSKMEKHIIEKWDSKKKTHREYKRKCRYFNLYFFKLHTTFKVDREKKIWSDLEIVRVSPTKVGQNRWEDRTNSIQGNPGRKHFTGYKILESWVKTFARHCNSQCADVKYVMNIVGWKNA